MSLFGGLTPQARSRNLVEFKAGKMTLRENMVYPDKRKGLVYLYQGNDMLMHFCWKERTSNRAEDELVIFPEEVEFKKVTQNTTGRVYILKWKSTTKKLFFWMQEPKEDKDEEYCKKINNFLNNPPAPGFGGSDDGNSGNPLQPLMEQIGGAGAIDPSLLSNVLSGMNPTDLIPLLSSLRGGGGGAGVPLQNLRRTAGSTASPQRAAPSSSNTSNQRTVDSRPNTAPAATRSTGSTATPTNRTGNPSSTSTRNTPIQMNALTNVLANLGNNTSTANSSIDLCEIMKSENLIPLLSNKNVQDKIRPHLSEGVTIPQTENELRESISSDHFRQIVQGLSTILRSGELSPLLSQFNFPTDVINAVNQRDLQAFATALDRYYQVSNENSTSDATMDTN